VTDILVVRDAVPDDALAVAGVHVRSWQAGYRGLFPDDFLDALRPEDRARRYALGSSDPADPQTLVALQDGELAGFATVGPCRDAYCAGAGEIYAVYVDPPHWGTGVGRRLMDVACARLRENGHSDGVLWVLDGNVRAERFYRARGWEPDGASRLEDPWGIVAKVHRWRGALR
jgi:GNAT superfamily N-acetyltransferase